MSPGRRERLRRLPPGQSHYKAWQTMRLYRKQGRPWSARDLVALCEIGKRGANAYIAALLECGYVRLEAPATAGGAAAALYRLTKDSGPLAPRVVRGERLRLYDPNLDQLVEASGPTGGGNPEAIGNPDQTPIVRMPKGWRP